MYSSSRKRCPKTKWALKLLTAAFLAASPAAKSAVNNAYDALIIEARKGNTQPALSAITKLLTGYRLPYGPGKINRLLPFTTATVISNYQRVVMQLSPSLIVTCNNGKTRLHCGKRRSLWSRKIRIINGDKF